MDCNRSEAPAVKPPFSMRQNPEQVEEFFALQQGITDGLLQSLLDWTVSQYASVDVWLTDQDKLGHLERIVDRHIVSMDGREEPDELIEVLVADRELLLDAADIALKWADERAAALLENYLCEARSAYCVVAIHDGKHEIQSRQPQEMIELVERETNQPGRVAEHLRKAWSKCFGLHPDLNEACMEAVKAIEVAGAPVVIPDDPEPTLGKMCSAIRDKPSKWEADSEFDGGVLTVLSMMNMVWKGHLRHGDKNAPLEVSQEAAEMTVQTAVLLVSWFRSWRIRMKVEHS